ncbi:hypothetical protein DBV23_07295 [Edwardsiella ictaluri]|nr:hypothetical protein DBV23_07295 [Edwardsiella ictaluri]
MPAESSSYFLAFSDWLGDVSAVVPGQWRRIIGTSRDVTSLNFKIYIVRFFFQQNPGFMEFF